MTGDESAQTHLGTASGAEGYRFEPYRAYQNQHLRETVRRRCVRATLGPREPVRQEELDGGVASAQLRRPRFSDRIGVGVPSSRRLPQVDGIDIPLRNSLWNWVITLLNANRGELGPPWQRITDLVAVRFLKVPLDDVPRSNAYHARRWLRDCYDKLSWYEVYNLVEFLVLELGPSPWFPARPVTLTTVVNGILEEELSAYRFVEGQLAPISTPSEVDAIEAALASARSEGFLGVATHVDTALALLSRKPKPDYRNSIKESISAVESAARHIAGEKGGLKDALAALEKKGVILHGAMKAGLLSLYGYTSDDDGIRHAILDEPTVGFDEAKYMLVTCSAFATFLMSKAAATGLLNANHE